MTAYLITGAAILGGEVADIRIENGEIVAIGNDLARDGAEIVDGAGKIALPGLVDLHTHLREPGREDAETVLTGTRAAAMGGFTAVFAMANTDPVADTAGVVEQVWRLGREAGLVDVVPVGAVTVGLAGGRMGRPRAGGAPGPPGPGVFPHRGLGARPPPVRPGRGAARGVS